MIILRSGSVNIVTSALKYTGIFGYIESSSGVQKNAAYVFLLTHVGIGASAGPADRYSGFSLRCLQEYKLVRSGATHMGNSFLRQTGILGTYWSCSGAVDATTYYLNFYASGVYPSHGPHARYNGFSLRCLQE